MLTTPVRWTALTSALRQLASRPRAVLALIVAGSALLHLYFTLHSDVRRHGDSAAYLAAAKNLAHGDGFLDAEQKVEARRTPGYPLFLAPLVRAHASDATIAAVQHTLAVLFLIPLFYIVRRMTNRCGIALGATALTAFDPGLTLMSNMVMSELLMTVCVVLAAYLLWLAACRGDLALSAAAGIALGVTTMVKPATVYLFLPTTVWFAWAVTRLRWRNVLMYFACAVLLPLLWIARNDRLVGVPTISSITGEDVYYWRAAATLAMQQTGFQYSLSPFRGEEQYDYQFFRVQQRRLIARADAELRQHFGRAPDEIPEAEKSRYLERAGWQIIRAHFPAYVLVSLNGTLHLVFDGAWMFADAMSGGFARLVLLWVMIVFNVLIFPLAIAGIVRLYRLDRRTGSLVALLLLYFVAVLSGPEHEQWRYRVPPFPLYAMAIAAGAAYVALRLRARGSIEV